MSDIVSNISDAWHGPGTDKDYATERFDVGKFSTRNSRVNNKSKVFFDPTIRKFQNDAISTFLGRNEETRNRFLGSEAAYTRARLNPLREQFATRRGEIQRSIGLRGIGGSSFGDQAMTNFDIDSGRALGDAGALAERENLQAITGLDAARVEALMNLSKDRLNQEIAGLGISQQHKQMLFQAFEASQNRRLQQAQNLAKGAETFHTLVTDWGDFAKIGGGGGGSG